MDLGIVCASFPSLKALVTRMLPKILGSTRRDENGATTIGGQSASAGRARRFAGGVQGSRTNEVGEYDLDKVSVMGTDGRGGMRGERESQEELTKDSC